ncbi:MAG: EF-P 5-aminopentanol modification-associated protein YfmF [Clostridia bacterium]
MFVGSTHDGISVYVHPTDRFKTIALYAVWVEELDAGTAALTAMVPYCLRRGTTRYRTFTAMQAHLEDLYGASFRADVGKMGERQLLSFRLEIPDGRFLPGHPDTLAAGLDFLHAVMETPNLTADGRFPESVVQQEKDILHRQIEGLINDKAQYALLRCLESMADGARFGVPRYGRVEDLVDIGTDAVTARWSEGRKNWPLMVFAVGAVDPATFESSVRERFLGQRSTRTLPPLTLFSAKHQGRLIVDEEDVRQGKLQLGLATGIQLSDPDYAALMMYSGVLGGFPHSKLFVNVREKASLAYYAYARVDGALGLMMIGAGIEFSDFRPALDIIRRQLDDMREGRISEEEMSFTLESFTSELRAEADSPSALIGRELETRLVGGGPSSEELGAQLAQVTRDDMVRVGEQVEMDTIYFLTARGEVPTDA